MPTIEELISQSDSTPSPDSLVSEQSPKPITKTPDPNKKVKCPYCKKKLLQSRLKTHLKKPPCSLQAHPDQYPNHEQPKDRLILDSKRGKKYHFRGRCSNCSAKTNMLWCYSRSNWGKVFLCSACKNEVYTRSHGKKDAWALVVDKSNPGSGHTLPGQDK